jgi:hypothetical protein
MIRTLLVPILGLTLIAGNAAAAEIDSKLKSVQPDKKLLIVTVDDKIREFTVPDDAEIMVQDIRPYIPKDRLADVAFKEAGRHVRITTAKKGDAEVVTKVVLFTGRKG